MEVKDLIRAGKTDLLQELYDAVLDFIDVTEDEDSIKAIDEAEEKLHTLSNKCVSESRLARLKQTGYAYLYRKSKGKCLPMLKLLEGGKGNGSTTRGKDKS